jgi:hypothetical protein
MPTTISKAIRAVAPQQEIKPTTIKLKWRTIPQTSLVNLSLKSKSKQTTLTSSANWSPKYPKASPSLNCPNNLHSSKCNRYSKFNSSSRTSSTYWDPNANLSLGVRHWCSTWTKHWCTHLSSLWRMLISNYQSRLMDRYARSMCWSAPMSQNS